jgi:hypothetical protein
MDDIPNELLPAIRQYRGNNRDEFVFGFDQCEVLKQFEELKSRQLVWHDASIENPDCSHFTKSSACVLVVRDCGPGTLESYAISRYREDSWGSMPGTNRKYFWLDQEVNGYRVTKWAYLGCSKDIVIKDT